MLWRGGIRACCVYNFRGGGLTHDWRAASRRSRSLRGKSVPPARPKPKPVLNTGATPSRLRRVRPLAPSAIDADADGIVMSLDTETDVAGGSRHPPAREGAVAVSVVKCSEHRPSVLYRCADGSPAAARSRHRSRRSTHTGFDLPKSAACDVPPNIGSMRSTTNIFDQHYFAPSSIERSVQRIANISQKKNHS